MSKTETTNPHELHKETPVIPESGKLGFVIDKVSDLFAIAILASAAILIIEVFLRYFFNAPTIWGHETVVFLTASSFIFGGLLVAARDAHIRVVIFYDTVSNKTRRWMNIIISAFCALSAFFFTMSTWVAVQRALFTPAGEFRIETSGTAFDAPFPGIQRTFLFIILLVLTIQFIILTVNYYRQRTSS